MSTNTEPSIATSVTTGGFKRPLRYIFDTADHQEFMKSKVRVAILQVQPKIWHFRLRRNLVVRRVRSMYCCD